jgi:hypothetical protein
MGEQNFKKVVLGALLEGEIILRLSRKYIFPNTQQFSPELIFKFSIFNNFLFYKVTFFLEMVTYWVSQISVI